MNYFVWFLPATLKCKIFLGGPFCSKTHILSQDKDGFLLSPRGFLMVLNGILFSIWFDNHNVKGPNGLTKWPMTYCRCIWWFFLFYRIKKVLQVSNLSSDDLVKIGFVLMVLQWISCLHDPALWAIMALETKLTNINLDTTIKLMTYWIYPGLVNESRNHSSH